MGVRLIGMANKMYFLQRSWALPNDSKRNEESFLIISMDLLRLPVIQTPRSRDLAIFVLMTTADKPITLTSCCACMRGIDKLF